MVAERMPEVEGRYLVIVHYKGRYNGAVCVRHAFRKVMCLEFSDGEFWLDQGAPGKDMFVAWTFVPDGWQQYLPSELHRESLPYASLANFESKRGG